MTPHPVAVLKAALRAHWLARPDLAAAFGERIVETLPPGPGLPFLLMGEASCRDEPGGHGVELGLLLAPVLVNKFGLPLMPVHLFFLFYACLSAITPPVPVANFSAAAIAGANPFKMTS